MRRIPTALSARYLSVRRSLLLATALLGGLSTAAEARRIIIDGNQYGNTYEVSTDLEDGQSIPLAFAVNYGSGLQSNVTANLGRVASAEGTCRRTCRSD